MKATKPDTSIEIIRETPMADPLRDLFIHLWSRLDQASFISNGLSKSREPMSESMRRNLEELARIADVNGVYRSMKRMLDEAGTHRV